MVIAVIFAGGIGLRMNSTVPKQFLKVNGKPILAHTIDKFEKCSLIDRIILIANNKFLKKTKQLVKEFAFKKVYSIVCGSNTAIDSQYNGINECKKIASSNDIVVLHDGVRPLIDTRTIEECIKTATTKGNAVTISPAIETIGLMNDNLISKIYPREQCILARAPQCFRLGDLLKLHSKRIKNNLFFVDSASMFLSDGVKLNFVEGPSENIKITTNNDFIFLKALMEKNKNE